MLNTEHLHDQMRHRRAYRGTQLAVYVQEHADENGVYTSPSMTHLQRLLARPEDGKMTDAKVADVHLTIRQLISQGVLEPESEGRHLILAGGRRSSASCPVGADAEHLSPGGGQ